MKMSPRICFFLPFIINIIIVEIKTFLIIFISNLLRGKKLITKALKPVKEVVFQIFFISYFFASSVGLPLYPEIFDIIPQWSCSAWGSLWEMPDSIYGIYGISVSISKNMINRFVWFTWFKLSQVEKVSKQFFKASRKKIKFFDQSCDQIEILYTNLLPL